MTTALVWFAVALGALVGMVVAMTLVGYGLPRQHVVTRTRTLPVDPPTAWAALVDFPGQVAWRRGLTAIDRLPDADGAEVWREQSGRRAVAFRTVIADPPTRRPAWSGRSTTSAARSAGGGSSRSSRGRVQDGAGSP